MTKNFKNYDFAAPELGIILDGFETFQAPKSIIWLKPPATFFKLNVNATSINDKVACGGIIKNDFGKPILGFAGPCSNYNVNVVVNFAILYGLKLCFSLECLNIIVEVSSSFSQQICVLDKDTVCHADLFYIRREIIFWLRLFNWSFSVIQMEGNACAHGIAEWGCLLDSMVDVHISNFPNHIIGDIMADLERRLLERFGDVCCSIIFWVLVLAHRSLFIGFYVTLFSRELKIVGFLVSFIFVALLSSSELESPLKTL